MNCGLMFFFFLAEIKGVLCYTKWDSKNGNECLDALISCQK